MNLKKFFIDVLEFVYRTLKRLFFILILCLIVRYFVEYNEGTDEIYRPPKTDPIAVHECLKAGEGRNLVVEDGVLRIAPAHSVLVKFDTLTTLGQAAKGYYSDFEQLGGHAGMGGVKFMMDLSARTAEMYNVNVVNVGDTLRMYSVGAYSILHMQDPTDTTGMVNRLLTEDVIFISGKVK